MKSTLAIVLVILLGVALGVGTAELRIRLAPWDRKLDESVEKTPPAPSRSRELTPKVVVDQPDYDFGTLDIAVGGSHEFTLSNVGRGPLKLSAGESSCRCTTSELSRESIPPGRSAKVTVTWKPAQKLGPYKQGAKILTNDPSQPQVTLTVSGKITAAARLVPPELVFSRMSAGEASTGEARLYCYLDTPLKIADHTWSDAATASYFDATVEPLSADELKEEPSARSGMLVRVTVKPGLPQGPIEQRLVIQTNVATTGTQTLLIQGIIGSEIAIAGPGWNPVNGVLNVGVVARRTGMERKLILFVRGPGHNKVEFKVAQVEPNLLKASLGPPSEVNKGVATQIPLTIDIPPNSPAANHLGSEQGPPGEIVVETSHPHVPKLRILVRFAIEG
jgi:hypothetical protein